MKGQWQSQEVGRSQDQGMSPGKSRRTEVNCPVERPCGTRAARTQWGGGALQRLHRATDASDTSHGTTAFSVRPAELLSCLADPLLLFPVLSICSINCVSLCFGNTALALIFQGLTPEGLP